MPTQIRQPEFGHRLRTLRSERGMSQRDLASGTVNQSYISLLESGARVPTSDVVMHLARVLNVSFDALTGGDGSTAGGELSGPARSRLIGELLATSAMDQGDLDQAEQRMTQAYREALTSGNAADVLLRGLALERMLELCNNSAGRYKLVRDLLPVAERLRVPEALVRTRTALSSAARDTGRLDEAFTQIERAGREIMESAYLNGSEHVRLLGIHISVLSDAGAGAEIVRLVDSMLGMAEALGRPAISGRAHWVASVALTEVGDAGRPLEHLRLARRMLGNPSTSLRDWARFSRAAASAVLDAEAELSEITSYMSAARAATMAESDATGDLLASLEVRYAIACGELDRALTMAKAVELDGLPGVEAVRFAHALGTALHRAGRVPEAVAALRQAAERAESVSAYRRAALIWRKVNDLLTS